jgi:hypothetical protein
MFIRPATIASLSLAALLLAGCGSQPVAGPVPVRVSPAAAAFPQSDPAAGSPGAALPTTPGGFSLPIGADISPPTPDLSSSSAATGEQRSQAQPSQQLPPATPATPPASSPAPAQVPFINLSAGIAVPQSLPTGTAMAISVDYERYAELKTSSRYALVVKSNAGEIATEVKLESSGNLSVFIQQFKPEHRPFTARIEEVTPGSKRRTIVSNEVTLKTDY